MITTNEDGSLTITGDHVELYALLSLRAHLKLEIKLTRDGLGRMNSARTLRACHYNGFTGRTRKAALLWINEILAPIDELKH